MNSPCFSSSPYIFYPVSDTSATESDDSVDSGREKTVGGGHRTTKYADPKQRTINKVSKKILKAIERITCNLTRSKKEKKVAKLSIVGACPVAVALWPPRAGAAWSS
ncbi:putative DCAPL3 [Operophtera brumata]|uniref:Putative DCAPL3 n=1 Tax=Operophtera brumata TaxID=104452 RepID=A0A0L7L5Y9_OPEBR|nr:putative DCAPL3 [Operophtera brumata]